MPDIENMENETEETVATRINIPRDPVKLLLRIESLGVEQTEAENKIIKLNEVISDIEAKLTAFRQVVADGGDEFEKAKKNSVKALREDFLARCKQFGLNPNDL